MKCAKLLRTPFFTEQLPWLVNQVAEVETKIRRGIFTKQSNIYDGAFYRKTIFAKNSIINIWQNPKYVSGL